MALIDQTLSQIAFKNLQGKSHTDNNKGLGNEADGIFLNSHASSIFMDAIDSDPNITTTNGFCELIIGADLVLDTTSNGHSYFAEYPSGHTLQGQRITNAINPSYGFGYEAKPFDSSNDAISVNDSRNWVYQYNSGIFYQQDNLGPIPTTINIYVYIGDYLDDLNFQIEAQGEYSIITYTDDVDGNDITGKVGIVSLPYKTIEKATQSAKEYLDSNLSEGVKALTVVRRGTYYEHTINREHVDMYFEPKAIVISTVTGRPIFNDVYTNSDGTVEPLNINIKGFGEFYHNAFNPSVDSQAIATNNTNTKNFTLQAYELDGIQNYGNHEKIFKYNDIRIRFTLDFWYNTTNIYENCTFLSGITTGHFLMDGSLMKMNNCEFILPSDNYDSLLDIVDYNGVVVDTITNLYSTYAVDSTSGYSREDYRDYLDNVVLEPLTCAIQHHPNDGRSKTFRLEITNSTVRIQKENAVGVSIIQSLDYSNTIEEKEGYITFRNIQIEDETITKNTTGVVVGKRIQHPNNSVFVVNNPINIGLVSIMTNCIVPFDICQSKGSKLTDNGELYDEISPSYINLPLIIEPTNSIISPDDKNLISIVTTTDGDKLTNSTVSSSPLDGSYVAVFINGQEYDVGNGVKTNSCYFSNDNGVTAKGFLSTNPNGKVEIGDTLHWNGSVAGLELDAGFRVSLFYLS